jgi:hypothetical protein
LEDGLTAGDSAEVTALETVEISHLLKVKFLSLWLASQVRMILMMVQVAAERVLLLTATVH